MTKETLSAQTTSELIAERIRNAIIVGEYESGEALKQDVLAEKYGVSKIPVREALFQLKTEGLVDFIHNRGSVVSSLSTEEVEEIYTMRMALEQIALERAIPHLLDTNRIGAESILRLIDTSSDPIDWTKLNWDFHASLYRAANMPKLLETIEMLHNNVARYLPLYLKQLKFQDTSQAEHWSLLEACSAKNTSLALTILQQHLDGALEHTLDLMNPRSQA